MKKILFSIIIPTYNREEKLKRALNSVINQTYKEWEIIIIDNNSKDGTKKMVKGFKDTKIKLFSIKNNGIIAKSRNLGIKKSKGKYLAFLDSDDYWQLNKLSECYNFLKKNKKTKLIYHDMFVQRRKNQKLFKKISYLRKVRKPIKEDLIINGPAFPTSSVVVEKKIFKKINFFNENKNLIAWEDYDAWLRLSQISSHFYEIKKTLGFLWIDSENTLNAKRQIKNIYSFKKKYLDKNFLKLTEWCNYSLMRSYLKEKNFDKSLKFLKNLKIEKYNLINKIKILFFYISIKFRFSI